MRAMWSGTISFGLVSIPVKLYSAISPSRTSFRLLAAEDEKPVKYRRYSPTLDREVGWDEIVKGLEVAKGEYVTFTKEELDELRPARSETIDITEFASQDQLDPITYDKHYYVAPEKTGQRSFWVLKEALTEAAKVAIGRVVLRDKEYTVAIESYREGLLLTTLNYPSEIRDPADIAELQEQAALRPQEIELAHTLIDQLTTEELDLSTYTDTFREKLEAAMQDREAVTHAAPTETREEDLLDALRASLAA